MKLKLWILALLAAACASAPPGSPAPAEPALVFITSTPAPAGTATEEALPFRDLSTVTPTPTATEAPPTATAAIPTATGLPVAATQPPKQSSAPQPTQPPAIPLSPVTDASSAEQAVVDLSNAQRAQYGLPPLARDETLMTIAHGRSADMVARGYFDHYDPVTGAPLGKNAVLGAGFGRAGENIYWSSAALANLPAQAVTWFMNDAPHRDNILNTGYTALGVGIVWNGVGGWVLTQDFGGP
ncbi:MAG: CAP domain-containing protein [Chloroflexi bacterium]|nr:CAP domain-containing protein [Chloroflexota bacterium]MBI5293415.1 CAP domain-containing protein [Chloroflexota bacterium]